MFTASASATARASFAFYNTPADVEALDRAIGVVQEILGEWGEKVWDTGIEFGTLGVGKDGETYNINADVVAGKIAEATAAPMGPPVDAPGVAQLNPKYTFDTFVIGSSNRFAQAAASAVQRRVLPGTLTGAVLMLPAALWLLVLLPGARLWAMAGIALTAPLLAVIWALAWGLTRRRQPRTSPPTSSTPASSRCR